MTSLRDVVTRHVLARARRFPDLPPAPLDPGALSPRDAALAAALDHAVARRWMTLAAVLQRPLRREWTDVEPALQAVLLVGAAQLLLLDRVPDHAAINEAVAWAKRSVRPGAGALVNAVLRRVAALRSERIDHHDPARRDELPRADGSAWRLTEDVFAEDPLRRCAEQTSHGPALLERWRDVHGGSVMHDLAAHSLVTAPIIVAGPVAGLDHVTAHEEAGFHVYAGPRDELDAMLEREPRARVQDPATAAAVEATRDLAPRLIVDACAGLGTKTRQLAEVHPAASIIASDADPRRLALLRASFPAGGRVEVLDPAALREAGPPADLLVLDVPCSNTGVLARRVEAKYRFSLEALGRLRDRQRQIVADTLALLGNGGHLLFATCSIDPEENETQTTWLVRWHPFHVVTAVGRMPRGRPADPPARYADGGYFALLQRSGG